MLEQPTAIRCLPVRLSDIPLEVRMDAARRVAAKTGDKVKRDELLFVATWPSSRIYWVEESAREDLERMRAVA